MKVLVFAHKFEIGGSQANAIDLSVALRDRYGHEVVMFATPGPMVEVAIQRGLRFVPGPSPEGIPCFAMMRELRNTVLREQPDVLHVWDWWQAVHAFYGVHLRQGIPMVVSDMISDEWVPQLPRSVITTFGTPARVRTARALGWPRAEQLLPPVDHSYNAPGSANGHEFRNAHGIDPEDFVLVTVSRVVKQLKSESLFRTVDAVRAIGNELPLKLVIVGDGNARQDLERHAALVNSQLGRPAIRVLGELLDPRPAYAAADVVIGMGGSALRGMAFKKPVVVVGARGFASLFEPQTAPSFLENGIYGTGEGDPDNSVLVAHILRLATQDRARLSELGEFSRRFVDTHFALDKLAAQLDHYLRSALDEGVDRVAAAREGIRMATILSRNRTRHFAGRCMGRLRRSLTMRPGRANAGQIAGR